MQILSKVIRTFKRRLRTEGRVLSTSLAASSANERSRFVDYCKTVIGALNDLPQAMDQYIANTYGHQMRDPQAPLRGNATPDE
eukprot:14143584-Alexandrium_andersonii.AAC.1